MRRTENGFEIAAKALLLVEANNGQSSHHLAILTRNGNGAAKLEIVLQRGSVCQFPGDENIIRSGIAGIQIAPSSNRHILRGGKLIMSHVIALDAAEEVDGSAAQIIGGRLCIPLWQQG